jgi:hypothetical protein
MSGGSTFGGPNKGPTISLAIWTCLGGATIAVVSKFLRRALGRSVSAIRIQFHECLLLAALVGSHAEYHPHFQIP